MFCRLSPHGRVKGLVAPFIPVYAGEARRHSIRTWNVAEFSQYLSSSSTFSFKIAATHFARTNFPCAKCCLTALAVCFREHFVNGGDQQLAEA
jgi:hypothetical protein